MSGMPLSQIKHIVTLMFENRSFDNVLGALYPKGTANFDGVWNTQYPNVWKGKEYWPRHGTDMIQPFPDPNEEYQYVYRQLYDDFTSQWPPPNPTGTPRMNGFVRDYATPPKKNAPKRNPPNIMNYFEPTDVPVISGLAAGYAVCDHWHCSIPTQTLCNRSYVHAGTSSGYVNNTWDYGVFTNDTPTIYNLLSQAKINWRVYSDGAWWLSNTLLSQRQLWGLAGHFFDFDQFYSDVASESTFPPYVFLEPNYIWMEDNPENDEHPEAGLIDIPGHPSNVLYGEQLLFDVFTALTKSPAWGSTLFIILFDEHGGTFDHVPPPNTVSPDGVVIPHSKPGGSGFQFNRLGVRVPAVLVSPLIPAGTISNTLYDHTSVIKAVFEMTGLQKTLLKREAKANSLAPVVALSAARTDIPQITPRAVPTATAEMAAARAAMPLNDLQQAMMMLATQYAQQKAPAAAAAAAMPAESRQTIRTHADAWRVMAKMKGIEPALR
jgi:phospholipase C